MISNFRYSENDVICVRDNGGAAVCDGIERIGSNFKHTPTLGSQFFIGSFSTTFTPFMRFFV